MFGTIRKHQTWLWAVIITLTIISFVVFFSPYSRMDSGKGRGAELGSIGGQQITEDKFLAARREATLHYFFLSGGNWPDNDARQMGFDLERETFQWLYLIQRAERLGLHVDRESAAQVARELLAGFRRQGANNYSAFIKEALEPQGFTAEDFERFVRHYVAIQQIVATAGLSGKLVTPQEARLTYIRNNQEVSTEAAVFNGTNYMANITVSPAALETYFTNSQSRYRLPERIQVRYVEFGISNLLGQAEAELIKSNLTEMVTANMDRLGTNYTRFGATPDEAKTKIREEIIRGRALSEARKEAGDFARALFDQEPAKAENLDALAKTKGLEVKVSKPFDRMNGPEGLDAGPDFARAAFSRTAEEPFTAPVMGRNGVYVMVVDKKIPSEMPSFESIRSRVEADFRLQEAMKLARIAGQSFSLNVSNGLAQGKSFSDICKESNVKPLPLPPFSLTTRALPQLPEYLRLEDVKQLAFSTEPGKVSAFEDTTFGGVVVHVLTRLPVDEGKLAAALPAFTSQIRGQRVNEAFNAWFRKEASTALRDTPVGQPKQPPAIGAPGPVRPKA